MGCRITCPTSSNFNLKSSLTRHASSRFVEKQLIVSNHKKADVMADLRNLKFRPFLKVTKAEAAGETEAVVPAEEDEKAVENVPGSTDYDYLLGMAIWSLTKKKVCLTRRAQFTTV